jgi:hypothetical protein
MSKYIINAKKTDELKDQNEDTRKIAHCAC